MVGQERETATKAALYAPSTDAGTAPDAPSAETDLAAARHYLADNRDLRMALDIPLSAEIQVRELASGEHNTNYLFTHPVTDARLVLRVGRASQIEVESPSRYEYEALRILAPSGRIPKPFWMDDSPNALGHGVIVMEYLEGRPLDYRRPNDMLEAARILADIHSVPVPAGSGLMMPSDPLRDQYEECRRMFSRYRGSSFEDPLVTRYVERFFARAEQALTSSADPRDCCHIQNTEATADQFLIANDKPGRMVDWEKPLVGEVAQDIAYFLAPTSTIWQDGPILPSDACERFIAAYWNAVDGRFPRGAFDERFAAFSMTNNLRGITWSCQAWVDYHDPDRPLKHDSTRRRLDRYLSKEFLDYLDAHVFSA